MQTTSRRKRRIWPREAARRLSDIPPIYPCVCVRGAFARAKQSSALQLIARSRAADRARARVRREPSMPLTAREKKRHRRQTARSRTRRARHWRTDRKQNPTFTRPREAKRGGAGTSRPPGSSAVFSLPTSPFPCEVPLSLSPGRISPVLRVWCL